MKQKNIWLLSGVGSGIVLFFIFLLFEMILPLDYLSLWIVLLVPVLTGVLGFLSGSSIETLSEDNEVLREKNADLQKESMDQAINLSVDINAAMEDLNKYTNQLDTIVNNIHSGICFIDKDFRIESGYNETFVHLFGDRDYQGNSIIDSVFSILDNNTKSSLTDFLELCFINRTASSSMLNDANPIKEFEFIQVIDGTVIHSIINTALSIIKDKDKNIEKIMFLFNDITSEYELKSELEKRESEYNKRYSIMVALFGNDKIVIRRFIEGLEENMKTLSGKIKEIKQNDKNTSIFIDILGTVHSIKGESFALGFEKLSRIAGEFETFFKKIKNEVVGLENNLQIIGFYEKLNNEKREFDKTINALEEFLSVDDKQSEIEAPGSSVLDLSESVSRHLQKDNISFNLLRKELEVINSSSAEDMGKKSGFTLNTALEGIDADKYKLLKELFLHLVRNSVAHGIEMPDDRVKAGKLENGKIILDIKEDTNSIIFEYSDDGRGFDVEKIKRRAIEHGIVTEFQASRMNNMEIIKLVFNDGFSTSDSQNNISGTGVGLSVVKKNIFKELKGKFNLINKPGKGIKVRITIQK